MQRAHTLVVSHQLPEVMDMYTLPLAMHRNLSEMYDANSTNER